MPQRDFDDAACRNILGEESHKEISGSPNWTARNVRVEARWVVRNHAGHRLELIVSIPVSLPWRVHVILRVISANVVVSRLDVRDDHKNSRTNGQAWWSQTHLHLWSPQYKDSHAIDFPLQSWDDAARVRPEGELEKIFRTACEYWHIEVGDDLAWQDPSVDTGWIDVQLEGEIP